MVNSLVMALSHRAGDSADITRAMLGPECESNSGNVKTKTQFLNFKDWVYGRRNHHVG